MDTVDVVLALISYGQRVLVGKRSPDQVTGSDSLHFTFPGGKIKVGETPVEAVIREAKEETGLDVKVVARIGRRVHPQTHRDITYLHCIVADAIDYPNVQSDEFQALFWVPIDNLSDIMSGIYARIPEYFYEFCGSDS